MHIVWTRPEGVSLALATSWGIRLCDSPQRCHEFEDSFGGGLMRTIGRVSWNREKSRFSAFANADAGRDDLVTLLDATRHLKRRGRPGDDWHEYKRWPGSRYLFVARPLTDYGDDIALIARVEDHVPAEWTALPALPTTGAPHGEVLA